MEIIELFTYPFIQRAVLSGVLLAVLAGVLGVFVVIRRTVFFGDTIAHSSLAGVAIGLWVNINPLLGAMIYAVGMALLIPLIKKRSGLHFDNILGILLPVSMSIGVIIFSLLPGFRPELLGYLFGNMLSISYSDLLLLSIIGIVIFCTLIFFLKYIILIAIDEEYARLMKVPVNMYEIMYHVFVALTVVMGVKLVGIILVNALLVIPASIVKLYARSIREMLILSPLIGLICVILGIIVSFITNIPSGSAIAVTSGVLFIFAILGKLVKL